jgi:hypothetical protein
MFFPAVLDEAGLPREESQWNSAADWFLKQRRG